MRYKDFQNLFFLKKIIKNIIMNHDDNQKTHTTSVHR